MLILLSVLNLFLSASSHRDPLKKTNLKVEIQNVRVVSGAVYIGLFRPGKDFPEGKSIETKKLNVNSKNVYILFSVEPGDYAIAVYHDENDNGKMDKRVFGIPKEPYGFSNNFKPVMSAPKFSDCRFSVGDDGKAISIKLI
ncbi:DUF2141 domain-containing protein [Spirosoma utsteinense]|uniref:DUF2141 domain-containing protein n=1 Tax=Spirosoma utsteinense TaxID=2585773 RepID=A0ABR6W0B1_9BACT|nr:DUF2141 domain-containing protein [Spirosoma utsteinense]MBC3786602.1 putative protein (DUF2141 family) [Spirosoma utsteinense]MBC3789980.1 putative protein (DUF2141 family) [Spirosoma utsteinense]